MTTKQSGARAPFTFDHLLGQLTLAFEPYQTVAELTAALDRAAACDAPEPPAKAIIPLWEEPLWFDSAAAVRASAEARTVEKAGWPVLADAEPEAGGRSPACHYTQKSDI